VSDQIGSGIAIAPGEALQREDERPPTEAEYAEALEITHARLAAVRELTWSGWRKGLKPFRPGTLVDDVSGDALRLCQKLATVAGLIEADRQTARKQG
jgi:hypothetical protein